MAKFQKGQSGNPAGRRPGVPNPSRELRKAIGAHVPEIIASLVQAALGGDTAAASLLLSRVLPPVKAETATLAITDECGMVERAELVVAETLTGNLSPTAAAELMTVLASQARIVEVAELERRLVAIEGRLT